MVPWRDTVCLAGSVSFASPKYRETSNRHILGGSWVVISGDISPLIYVRTIVTLFVALLITTREPPSI